MGIDNRKQKRVVLKQDVLINGSIKVLGLDLSVGGLYAYTGRDFKSGSVVNVTIPLNTNFISVQARIQHSQQNVGMGLRFINLTDEQLVSIRAFIDEAAKKHLPVAKKTIMIVDDNAAHRRMNKGKLVQDGFSIIEASDGVEALALLEKEAVDLIVLDLYMEILDGYKVLSIISQRPEWKNIPVIVLSARSSPAEIEKAMDAGAAEYLVKMMTSPVKLSQRIKLHLAASH